MKGALDSFKKYRFLGISILNKILAIIIVLILPIHAYAGFPEGENGYELRKIEESFKLPCSEIGNDQCLARVVSMGGCIYSCLLYTSPSPRDLVISRMPSSA